jgi:hypothetical protein
MAARRVFGGDRSPIATPCLGQTLQITFGGEHRHGGLAFLENFGIGLLGMRCISESCIRIRAWTARRSAAVAIRQPFGQDGSTASWWRRIKISAAFHASSRWDSRSHEVTCDQEEDEPQAHDR